MSVRKRHRTGKDGQVRTKYMIHIEYTHPDGHRQTIRKVSPVQTRRGAEAYERDVRAALLAGSYGKEPKQEEPAAIPTLSGFAGEFMENYVLANNKPSSQQTKATILRLHLLPFFGRVRLDQIDGRKIERYKALKLRALSRKSINNHLTVLRKMLAVAKEWGLIEQVPAIRWLKPPAPEFRFLGFDAADRLLEAAEEEPGWHAMILTALRTGLRLGELIGLRWRDVHVDRRLLQVRQAVARGQIGTPKSGRARDLPMGSGLARTLVEHRRRRGGGMFVFCQPGGAMLTKGMCKWPLRRARARAGLEVLGWHDLRHTFASHLAMRGVPLKVIQELLGHATIEMTMRYAHLSPSTLVDAVEALETPQHHDSTTAAGK